PFLEIFVRRFLKPTRIARGSRSRRHGSELKISSDQPSTPRARFLIPVSTALALALVIFGASSFRVVAAVREIGRIGITVGDLKRELAFYTNTLPFELLSISDESGPDQESLFGVKNAQVRIATLRLGDERITLTEHVGNPGKPVPQDSRS